MAVVHPLSKPDLQELALALVYWQQRGQDSLAEFADQAGSLQPLMADCGAGQRPVVVCSSAPLAGVVRRRVSGSGLVGPAPTVVEINTYTDAEVVGRARDLQDVPRSSWTRQVELAWAIERSPALRQLVAPTSGSAMALAAEWLELFIRWDWLLAAWRLLGAPPASPQTQPQVGQMTHRLQAVSAVWLLYQALFSDEDLVFWLAARLSQQFDRHEAPGVSGVRLISFGPPDAVDLARLVVLHGEYPQVLPLAWEHLNVTALPSDAPIQGVQTGTTVQTIQSNALEKIWPELRDLAGGHSPTPSEWPSLAARRQQFDAGARQALCEQLRWIETGQLEHAAQSASQSIESFLLANPDQGRVAVVATDRLAARRLSALLISRRIALNDPSGWTLDTTVAASVVMGLLDLVTDQVNRAGLMNWLSMPLVHRAFCAQGYYQDDSRALLYERLRRLTAHDRAGLWACLPRPVEQTIEQYMPVQSGQRVMSVRRFMQVLQGLGLWSELSLDTAGLALLSTLQSVAMSLPADDLTDLASTRSCLLAALSRANMPLPSAEARVHLVGLMDAACGDFQQTIVVGAAQGQFPSQEPSRLLDRGEMRLLRGEWTDAIEQAKFVAGLAALLASGQKVCFLALREEATQPVRWASALSRLMAIIHPSVEQWFDDVSDSQASLARVSAQMPRFGVQFMPEQVSVSALSSLPKCPYQFYWRAILGLDPLEALELQTEPRDLGSLLHQILATGSQAPLDVQSDAARLQDWFSTQWQVLSSRSPMPKALEAELLARLDQASRWWAQQVVDYAVHAVEQSGVVVLPKSGVRLKGRLDRLDQRRSTSDGSGGLRILDYKTGSPASLKERRRQDYSDLQLLAYGRMQSSGSVESLGYLSVGPAQVTLVEVEARDEMLDQADESMARLASGEPVLPLAAQGRAKACVGCAARHGCRARDWTQMGAGR
jgi:ATP-dependent helicase/nuclease subunit B